MKLRLTKKEKEAVKDSIEHWKKHIRKRLKSGDIIIKPYDGKRFYWKSDKHTLNAYIESCALCTLVNKKTGYLCCDICPYVKKYKTRCYHSTWNDFINQPNLKNCNNMVKDLENILK